MSYILDALRRADAERERGAVPGLQSGASPAADDGEPARGAGGARWPLAVGAAVGVALIGTLGWWLGAGSTRPEAPAVAALPPAAPPPMSPPAAAAAEPPAPASMPAFLPPPPVRESAAPPRTASAAVPAVAAASAAVPAVAAASAAVPAVAAASAAVPGPASPRASSAPAAPARLPSREELPDDLRRALPPLAVGGLMYSENADKRMVILDGRLLREGEALGNGLVLEQIRARSAVLSAQGTRFELKF